MLQNTSVQYLKGIGPARAKSFFRLGIRTIEDLLYHFPRRYEDRSSLAAINQLEEGNSYTIRAQILALRQHSSWRRRGLNITEAVAADNGGKLSCVWFNQPYLKEYIKPGSFAVLYGKVERYGTKLQMSNPEFELSEESEDALNTGRIVPIYTLFEGFTQRSMRLLMKNTLDEFLPKLADCLPYDLRKRGQLLNLAQSLLNIHFPANSGLQQEAYRRLSFEEFFIFELPLVLRKLKKKEKSGLAHKAEGKLLEDFIAKLPFKFTAAQERVIREIKSDMAAKAPMQRLLQGDVGSGKTVVATFSCLIAIQGGYQAVLMAPTEILARQHYEKIGEQLDALAAGSRKLKVGLLVAGDKDKKKVCRKIKDGSIDLVIGTHALLEEQISFKKLGLVVIDEQHKFGVSQRALLPKKGDNPDVLIMTATPIPRTLAITLYADLDVSVINELPPGRLAVETSRFSNAEREKAYAILKEELSYGRQGYIVYPVIEESYSLDIAGAKKMFRQLKEGWFKEFKVGLIHGRLRQQEQAQVMAEFKSGRLDLLVSTTVLEVGIDVPNATCMIVEAAERFGLSQLHQLRGRIGRGGMASRCLLICDAKSDEAKARLEAMVKFSDGFRIAEEDLRIRGAGEFFGSRQHGLTELKIANPLTQMQLLKKAREEALRLLSQDIRLEQKQHAALRGKLLQRFPEYESLILTG